MDTASSVSIGIGVLRTLELLDQRMTYGNFTKVTGWPSPRSVGKLLDFIVVMEPSLQATAGRIVRADTDKPGKGYSTPRVVRG